MGFWMFVSTVVVALAWPAAFLLALTWFRVPLTALLWRLAGPPQRASYPPPDVPPGGPTSPR